MVNCMFVVFTTIKQNKETLGPDHWGVGGGEGGTTKTMCLWF